MAEERSYVDKHIFKNFQLDIQDDNCWVELTTGITRVKEFYFFESNFAPQSLTKNKFKNSEETVLITDKELKKFWREIGFNNDMKSAIHTFSKEPIILQDCFQSKDRHFLIYPMRTVFFGLF